MKFLPVFLIVAVFAPAALGRWDAITDWMKSPEAVEKGIFGLSLGSAIMIHDAIDFGKKIEEGVTLVSRQIANKCEELYEEIKGSVGEFGTVMDKVGKKVLNFLDTEARQLLEVLTGYVNKTQDALQIEITDLEREIEVPAKEAIDFVTHKLDEFRDWGNNFINKFDDVKKLTILNAVREIMNHTSEKLQKCSEQTIVPVEEVFEAINKTISDAGDILRGLIKAAETCTDDDQSFINQLENCGKALSVALTDAYHQVLDLFDNLFQGIKKVGADDKHALGCFVNTFDIEANKAKIEDASKKTLQELKQTFLPF